MCKLNILGAGKLGQCVLDLIYSENQYQEICLFDDNLDEIYMFGKVFKTSGKIKDGIDKIELTNEPYIITLGLNYRDKTLAIFESLKALNRIPVSIISKKSTIASSATLGANSVVFPGTYIGCGVTINHSLICYSNVSVEHHISVGHSVCFAPGVKIASGVHIGDNVFIGIGSIITNNIMIEDDTIIGAGTLVLKNIAKKTLAYGVPMKIEPVKKDFRL
jgi:sugar O-acyltransferase (sialic acid O-acetyltransferase NeuD family)